MCRMKNRTLINGNECEIIASGNVTVAVVFSLGLEWCPLIDVSPFSSIVYCNFDSGSLCDFTQATGDQFDWTLHKGPTSTGGTGPGTDMSGKGQLYDYPIFMGFLLIEIRQARRVVK